MQDRRYDRVNHDEQYQEHQCSQRNGNAQAQSRCLITQVNVMTSLRKKQCAEHGVRLKKLHPIAVCKSAPPRRTGNPDAENLRRCQHDMAADPLRRGTAAHFMKIQIRGNKPVLCRGTCSLCCRGLHLPVILAGVFFQNNSLHQDLLTSGLIQTFVILTADPLIRRKADRQLILVFQDCTHIAFRIPCHIGSGLRKGKIVGLLPGSAGRVIVESGRSNGKHCAQKDHCLHAHENLFPEAAHKRCIRMLLVFLQHHDAADQSRGHGKEPQDHRLCTRSGKGKSPADADSNRSRKEQETCRRFFPACFLHLRNRCRSHRADQEGICPHPEVGGINKPVHHIAGRRRHQEQGQSDKSSLEVKVPFTLHKNKEYTQQSQTAESHICPGFRQCRCLV